MRKNPRQEMYDLVGGVEKDTVSQLSGYLRWGIFGVSRLTDFDYWRCTCSLLERIEDH